MKSNPVSIIRVDLIMISVVLIWGMNFSIMKGLYTWFDPLAFTALRFSVAVATLSLVLKMRGLSLGVEKADLPRVIGLGFLSNTIYQLLFVIGLANTTSGNAALLMASTPVIAYLAGVLLGREHFSRKVLGGILLSAAGVAAIVWFAKGGVSLTLNRRGDAMILGAAACWGWYTGSVARLIVKYGALRLTYQLMFWGTLLLLPLVLPSALRQSWASIPARGWLAFCYSTFLSIVYSYLAWSYAIRHAGVPRTAVYSNVTPLIALIGGWLILGERPVIAQLLGAALILAGVFLVRTQRAGING
jgi:drug/metabolite transporter (DMT)-like permease